MDCLKGLQVDFKTDSLLRILSIGINYLTGFLKNVRLFAVESMCVNIHCMPCMLVLFTDKQRLPSALFIRLMGLDYPCCRISTQDSVSIKSHYTWITSLIAELESLHIIFYSWICITVSKIHIFPVLFMCSKFWLYKQWYCGGHAASFQYTALLVHWVNRLLPA